MFKHKKKWDNGLIVKKEKERHLKAPKEFFIMRF
jgi:hypothetical protein